MTHNFNGLYVSFFPRSIKQPKGHPDYHGRPYFEFYSGPEQKYLTIGPKRFSMDMRNRAFNENHYAFIGIVLYVLVILAIIFS